MTNEIMEISVNMAMSRINGKLKDEGQQLLEAYPVEGNVRDELGPYYIVNSHTGNVIASNIDEAKLLELAIELGAVPESTELSADE